jgi:hypothetical protein
MKRHVEDRPGISRRNTNFFGVFGGIGVIRGRIAFRPDNKRPAEERIFVSWFNDAWHYPFYIQVNIIELA